jgi:GTP cyclohydrolase II
MYFEAQCNANLNNFSDIMNVIIRCYSDTNNKKYLVMLYGDINTKEPIHLRVHYECTLGNVFNNEDCDCNYQFHKSLEIIKKNKRGVLIYCIGQDGRNIGIINHISVLDIQQKLNIDTVEANLYRGHPIDNRDFSTVKQILTDLKIKKVILITNNPEKIKALKGFIVDTYNISYGIINKTGMQYLETKKKKLNHNIQFENIFQLNKYFDLSNYTQQFLNKKIAIVQSLWHPEVIDIMVKDLIDGLVDNGILRNNIDIYCVPGAWEIPYETNKLKNYDSIVCCNVSITSKKMNHINDNVAQELMKIQIKKNIPIIYFFTHSTYDQAVIKSKNKKRTHEVVYTTLHMIINDIN